MKLRTFLRAAGARRAGVAVTALSAALVLSGCGSGHSGPAMDHKTPTASASGAASVAPGSPADIMFNQMMIPHHQQAVEMADLADSRAQDPEVRQLAGQIRAAQAPEIATMSGWLAAWGAPTSMPGTGTAPGHGMPGMDHGMPGMDHGMPGMVSAADMDKLKAASGRDFDRQFLTLMIAHHQGAIQMAQDELTRGSNTEVKALAQRIIETQRSEIDTMNRILARL